MYDGQAIFKVLLREEERNFNTQYEDTIRLGTRFQYSIQSHPLPLRFEWLLRHKIECSMEVRLKIWWYLMLIAIANWSGRGDGVDRGATQFLNLSKYGTACRKKAGMFEFNCFQLVWQVGLNEDGFLVEGALYLAAVVQFYTFWIGPIQIIKVVQ